MPGKRSFTLEEVRRSASGAKKGKSNVGGRFESRTPASAAKKAATRVCRMSKIKGQCSLVVHIRETTAGSAGKVFKYKVRRVLKPRTVMRNGVKVTYKYATVVKAC